MSRAALVVDDVAVNVIEIGDIIPDGYIPCGTDVGVGFPCIDGVFYPPAPQADDRPLEQMRADAIAAAEAAFAIALRTQTGSPSTEEALTFPAKQEVVRAFRAGDLSGDPLSNVAAAQLALLQAEATSAGKSLAEMVDIIEAKVTGYHAILAALQTARDARIAAITAAETREELAAIIAAE